MYEVNSPLGARIISMQNIKHSEIKLGSINAKSVLERCVLNPPWWNPTTILVRNIYSMSNDHNFFSMLYN